MQDVLPQLFAECLGAGCFQALAPGQEPALVAGEITSLSQANEPFNPCCTSDPLGPAARGSPSLWNVPAKPGAAAGTPNSPQSMDEMGFCHMRSGAVPLFRVRATVRVSPFLQDSGSGVNIHISYLYGFWIDMREATLQLSPSLSWRNNFTSFFAHNVPVKCFLLNPSALLCGINFSFQGPLLKAVIS